MMKKSEKIQRTAAYCRVSTDKEEQESSLEIQERTYRDIIQNHEGWEFAGIYADDGISGTQAARREAFCRMIDDCEAGKIDRILTKSISRFARNTLECLMYVKKLKSFGVTVYFEKENLDTGNAASEMILSIMAAVAQEESRNLSENQKWSQRKRFEAGIVKWSKVYGYQKVDGQEFIPDPATAPIVVRIFTEYAYGRTIPQIIAGLNAEQIPSPQGSQWRAKTLDTILRNEKYCGDARCQKSYTVDHLTHKRMKNDQEEVPSFYIKNHHTPLVERTIYDMVQEIRQMKDRHNGPTQYPYKGRILCPICGRTMERTVLERVGSPAVWHCPPMLENQTGANNIACAGCYLFEEDIDALVRTAYEQLTQKRLEALQPNELVEAAIRMKIKMPILESVEYYFLETMIQVIEYRTWNTAVVYWKCGLDSEVIIRYRSDFHTPGHKRQLDTNISKMWLAMAKGETANEDYQNRGKKPH